MKILVITDSYPPHHSGGYELRCKDVVEGLRAKGNQVFVVTSQCDIEACTLHNSDFNIYRILHNKSRAKNLLQLIINDLADIRKIDNFVIKYEPDLIYLAHLGNLSNTIFPYISSRKVPFIFDDGGFGIVSTGKIYKRGLYFYKNDRDNWLKSNAKRLITALVQMLSRSRITADRAWPKQMQLLFNSKFSKQFALENQIPAAEGKVIYSGIDVSTFVFKQRKTLEMPLKIIMPGRISPEKGMIDAVDLMKYLRHKGISANLTIVGKKYSQEYYEKLIEEINVNDLENDIRVLPMMSHKELAKLYQEADFCFFSSYQSYGLSRIPFESMASGCLVISYGNEGSGEIIQDKRTGCLILTGDVQECANTIERLFADPVAYSRIVGDAHKSVLENFTLQGYIDQIEQILIQTVQKWNVSD